MAISSHPSSLSFVHSMSRLDPAFAAAGGDPSRGSYSNSRYSKRKCRLTSCSMSVKTNATFPSEAFIKNDHHTFDNQSASSPRTLVMAAVSSTDQDARNSRENQIRSQLPAVAGRRSAVLGRALAAAICNATETLIMRWIEAHTTPATRIAADPEMFTVGNFAPVDECPPCNDMEIVGTLPSCLNGAYVRNGSNPHHGTSSGYQYFDGDGMLHVVKIRDGKATYCSRYTRTNRWLHEEKAGRPLFPKALGEVHGLVGLARLAVFSLRGLLGVVDIDGGIGTANAGLAFFNGKLLAMSEEDKPYAVHITDDGDLHTIGRYDFGGELKTAMTAHPKIDPQTGELFSYSCGFFKAPHLSFFRVSADGKKGPDVSITLPTGCLIHDFALTANYIVFPDTPILFYPKEMLNGKSPVNIDEKKMPRFGVLPKSAKTEAGIKWFDLPDSTCFHYANAWEEGDEIVVIGDSISPISNIFYQPEKSEFRPSLFRLNLKTGEAYKQQLANANVGVQNINPLYYGKKMRYVYSVISGPWPKYGGIAKLDLQLAEEAATTAKASRELQAPASTTTTTTTDSECIVGWRRFPTGCFCGEPFFVPRNPAADSSISEDDGYVITHFHDESSGLSELLVMDARSPTLETVASVKLPSRVPYGFHSLFVPDEQLAKQKPQLSSNSWQ